MRDAPLYVPSRNVEEPAGGGSQRVPSGVKAGVVCRDAGAALASDSVLGLRPPRVPRVAD